MDSNNPSLVFTREGFCFPSLEGWRLSSREEYPKGEVCSTGSTAGEQSVLKDPVRGEENSIDLHFERTAIRRKCVILWQKFHFDTTHKLTYTYFVK